MGFGPHVVQIQLLTVGVVYEIDQFEILVVSASVTVYGADVIALRVKDSHFGEGMVIFLVGAKEIVVIKEVERGGGYGLVRFQGHDPDIAGYVLKYCRNGFVGVYQDYTVLTLVTGYCRQQ